MQSYRETGCASEAAVSNRIVFSPAKNIREMEQLFRVSPDYF